MSIGYEIYIDAVDNGFYLSLIKRSDGAELLQSTRVFNTAGELTGYLMTTLMETPRRELDVRGVVGGITGLSAKTFNETPRRLANNEERDEHGLWKTPPAYTEAESLQGVHE